MIRVLCDARNSPNECDFLFGMAIGTQETHTYTFPLKDRPFKENLPKLEEQLVSELSQVKGIKQVEVSLFGLYILKNDQYDWSDIKINLAEAIKKCLRSKDDRVCYYSSD